MSNLAVFFNTKVEGSGIFAGIGDLGLAPFRYLFNGKTIRVELRDTDQTIEIHHVASFHKLGSNNSSQTARELRSSPTGMIKTVSAVVALIPGLVLALSKVFAYLFSDVRAKHRLAKEHLTPVDRHIGNVFNPIQSINDLVAELKQEFDSDLKHRPTNALIIHGNGNLEINEDPGILRFNPMKLVLEGAAIVHRPSLFGRLDNAMHATGKWETKGVRKVSSLTRPDNSFIVTHQVCSIEEALQTTAPWRSSLKRSHMVFTLATPKCDKVVTTAGLLHIPEGTSVFDAQTT